MRAMLQIKFIEQNCTDEAGRMLHRRLTRGATTDVATRALVPRLIFFFFGIRTDFGRIGSYWPNIVVFQSEKGNWQ